MSYGTAVYSNSGELLVSQEIPLPHYLGQATYWGIVGVSDTPLLEYRITSPGGPPLPFIRVYSADHNFGVYSTTQLDATTWRIIVVSTLGSNTTTIRHQAEVHCFAVRGTAGPVSSYGVRVLAANGTVCFDSTAGPLTIAGTFSFGGSYVYYIDPLMEPLPNPVSTSVANVAYPAVFGGAPSGATRDGRVYWGGYRWGYNGTISLDPLRTTTPSYLVTDEAPYNDWYITPHTGSVINLSDYI